MTYLASYAFLQNAQCQPLKCQALNDVGNYCEESRCKNQWIPYLSLQERWTTRQAVAVNERMRVFLCERKQTCAAPAAVDCCVLWRGWEREKVELSERHIPPCPCSLSCPPWGEKWSCRCRRNRAVGTWTVEGLPVGASCDGEVAGGRRGRVRPQFHMCNGLESHCTSAPAYIHLPMVHYRWLWDYVFWKWRMKIPFWCRTNCSNLYAELLMDCNCFCRLHWEIVFVEQWNLSNYWNAYYELL